MAAIKRFGVEVPCPRCGRANALLLPEASCGSEFVWHARCGGCGGWRWFHSREDRSFVLAIRDAARRRGEEEGLSPEGTREAHAAFHATLEPCGCGGRFHVVREVLDEACLACGASLRGVSLPPERGRAVDVAPLRPSR